MRKLEVACYGRQLTVGNLDQLYVVVAFALLTTHPNIIDTTVINLMCKSVDFIFLLNKWLMFLFESTLSKINLSIESM